MINHMFAADVNHNTREGGGLDRIAFTGDLLDSVTDGLARRANAPGSGFSKRGKEQSRLDEYSRFESFVRYLRVCAR